MARKPVEPPDFSPEEPAAAPTPAARPAAPATRRAPDAAIPDPSATGVFPAPLRLPDPSPVGRPVPPVVPPARPAPAPVAPSSPVGRPVPPFVAPAAPVAPATTEVEYEDDEVPQKKGGTSLRKVLTGTTIAALACAGLAYYADDLRDVLRGDEVVQPTVVPAPTIPAPTVPKSPLAPVVTPAPEPTKAPTVSTWTNRSTTITSVRTPAIAEELTASGAKASVTVDCKDGAPVNLFSHYLPTEKPIAVDANKDTAETMYTNYGTVNNPWNVCEDAGKGSSQWTVYLGK